MLSNIIGVLELTNNGLLNINVNGFVNNINVYSIILITCPTNNNFTGIFNDYNQDPCNINSSTNITEDSDCMALFGYDFKYDDSFKKCLLITLH